MGETYHPRGELVDGYRVREHPIYSAWSSMKERCNNPDAVGFENYGGRGITYCQRWSHFRFFAEDMFPTYEPGLTIERVDNEKGYGPSNCKWAGRTEQMHNRRMFKNNTSGFTGIQKTRAGFFKAKWDHDGHRYELGSFPDLDSAKAARDRFIEGFHAGDPTVKELLVRRARLDGSTGVKGVTRHKDGFIIRVTVGKERRYLGIRKTIEEAVELLRRHENDR